MCHFLQIVLAIAIAIASSFKSSSLLCSLCRPPIEGNCWHLTTPLSTRVQKSDGLCIKFYTSPEGGKDRRYALLVDLVGISNSVPLKITTKLVWLTCMLDSVLPFVIQVAIQPVDIYVVTHMYKSEIMHKNQRL